MSLKTEEEQALKAFRAWLNERFGSRVRRVRLFGSLARGERHEESDVDVAVEIDGMTSAEGREVGYFTGDLLTDYGVVVSAFAVSTERMDHLRNRERAIALEIDRDGVPL
jgi:predicted nucleotidyltransferase